VSRPGVSTLLIINQKNQKLLENYLTGHGQEIRIIRHVLLLHCYLKSILGFMNDVTTDVPYSWICLSELYR
jgi:hypothetical protein